MLPNVAFRLVGLLVIAVNVVNAPVLGVALPIGVLLILAKLAVPAFINPPTYNAPTTPAPPATCNAPLVVLVAAVLFATNTAPPLIVPYVPEMVLPLSVPIA